MRSAPNAVAGKGARQAMVSSLEVGEVRDRRRQGVVTSGSSTKLACPAEW